jgi:hypothetical protein
MFRLHAGGRIGRWETAFPVANERGIQHKPLFYRSVRRTTGWIPWRSSSPVERGPVAAQGVRGLLVRDEKGEPVVYVLCEPATRYYRVMTRSERMPVLIGEHI